MRYIRYVRINVCTVGTVAIIVDAGTMPSSLAGELSMMKPTIVAFFNSKDMYG